LLVSNTLGLPNLLEANNETSTINDILKCFKGVVNQECLVIKNLKEKHFLTGFVHHFRYEVRYSNKGTTAFVSKSPENVYYFGATMLSTDRKRKLRLSVKKTEIDKLLLVSDVNAYGVGFRIGLSEAQFKEEFTEEKEFDYVATNNTWVTNTLMLPHLKKLGFKRVLKIPKPGLNRYAYRDCHFNLYAKD
jgi:hypothetical protein